MDLNSRISIVHMVNKVLRNNAEFAKAVPGYSSLKLAIFFIKKIYHLQVERYGNSATKLAGLLEEALFKTTIENTRLQDVAYPISKVLSKLVEAEIVPKQIIKEMIQDSKIVKKIKKNKAFKILQPSSPLPPSCPFPLPNTSLPSSPFCSHNYPPPLLPHPSFSSSSSSTYHIPPPPPPPAPASSSSSSS